MNFLDVRTVMVGHFITGAICTVVLVFMWLQNRKHFAGTAYWLLDFVLQTTATILIILRGSIPDWISMTLANTLALGGAWLGYMGLLHFAGKKSRQIHNYVLLAVFIAVHSYFVLVKPNLAARNVILSLGLLILCFQCVWFVLRRVDHSMRRMMREVGLVFGIFCLVNLIRIAIVFISPPPSNDFFHSGLYDTLMMLAYQILLIFLAFNLVLMVNRRLLAEVQIQEEKFAKAFRSSPYAITLTRASDGQILEVNEGFVNITGYSYAEVTGRTTVDLQLWVKEEERVAVVGELSKGSRVMEREFQFRKKSGEILTGLFSAEPISINDHPWVLSSISDITTRKRVEDQLRENERLLRTIAANYPRSYISIVERDLSVGFTSGQEFHKQNLDPEQFIGLSLEQVFGDQTPVVREHYLKTFAGQEQSFELFVNNQYQLYRTVPLYAEDGSIPRILSVVENITERKQAEEKIVSLAKFPDENPNPVLRVAQDGTILYANTGSKSLLAFWSVQVNGQVPVEWQQLVSDALAQNKALTAQVAYNSRIFAFTLAPVADAGYVNLYGLDITERKRAEEEISARISFLNSIMEQSPFSMWIADATGKILRTNRTLRETLNLTDAQILGKYNILQDDNLNKQGVMPQVKAVFEQQKPARFSIPWRTGEVGHGDFSDGRDLWIDVSIFPILDSVGNVANVVCQWVDITERKQVEKALEERVAFQSTLLATVPIPVFYKDSDGRYLGFNKAFETFFGKKAERLVGKSVFDVNPPELAEVYHARDRELFETGGKQQYESQVKQSDGALRQVIFYKSAIADNQGGVGGLIGAILDITERVRAEEAIQEYSKRLEAMVAERTRALEEAQAQLVSRERLSVLGQLSGSIAHELRTPLGAIKNAVYLLNMILETANAQTREALDILAQQVKISEQIINNLLDFARTRQPQKQPVDANQALSQALSRLNMPDGVRVQQDLADLPLVPADPGQLGQILGNLMLNAIQAMPGGGQLTLKTYLTQPERVAISITDTGVGIPTENREHLFEPLFTTKPKGIGLGLALVKMLVEAHDGDIQVVSTTGQGSTFTVELPIHK